MDAAARQAVNLNVLRRHDPAISAIVDTSSHVVVYNFDSATETWKKVGIEGTMFLFRKESLNRYGIFVMNRLSTDNHNEELNSEMEIQVMGDYVIYRTLDDKVVGLWIYEASDRARIAKELEKYSRLSGQISAMKPPTPSTTQEPKVDVMAMLQRAVETGPQGNSVQQPGLPAAGHQPSPPHNHLGLQPNHPAPPGFGATVSFPPAHSGGMTPGEQILAVLGQRPQPPSTQPTWGAVPSNPVTSAWKYIEDLQPAMPHRGLDEAQFADRLKYLVLNDPGFVAALFRAYSSTP